MQGHIPFRKVDLWLQSFRTIWLQTTHRDGRSHNVPAWYWWNSDTKTLYFTTSKNAAKTKNLAYDSRVVIHAGDGEDAIIIEGEAFLVTDALERQQIDQRWQEKYGSLCGKIKIASTDSLLYRVEISHLSVWRYGSETIRTDWHFDRTEVEHVV